ncbi:hypothetical protein EK21DRAFT_87906 [Setomelanomma holmii]|uniref:Uncharacterized protein n=1 Tax=Setomelanomma holmii TaxID=210430 RepID=A0A9P4HBK6_9PLEO|nr:hypothetical protein EK21DRAFT_87906 [Setomelanomma holmii]
MKTWKEYVLVAIRFVKSWANDKRQGVPWKYFGVAPFSKDSTEDTQSGNIRRHPSSRPTLNCDAKDNGMEEMTRSSSQGWPNCHGNYQGAVSGLRRMHLHPRADTISSAGQYQCYLQDCSIEDAFIKETGDRSEFETLDLDDHMQADHLLPSKKAVDLDNRVPGCKSDFTRTSPEQLLKHLKVVHREREIPNLTLQELSGDGKHRYFVPGRLSENRVSIETGNRQGNTEYDTHLARRHNLCGTESRLYKLSTYTLNATWLSIYLPRMTASREAQLLSQTTTNAVDSVKSGSLKSGRDFKCSTEKCADSPQSFNSKFNLQQHLQRTIPQGLLPSSYDRSFAKTNEKCYIDDLVKKHELAEGVKLDTWEKKDKDHPCFVPGCQSPTRFNTTRDYEAHLNERHRLHDSEARQVYLCGIINR